MHINANMVQLADNALAQGYLAQPKTGRGPGIIVVQEWWGLNTQIKGVTHFLAQHGFVALAPDLYRGELAGHDEMDKAATLMNTLPVDAAAEDMAVAVDYLLALKATTGDAVGVIGFCMGGMLSLILAAHLGKKIKAVVPFYGFPKGDDEPNWNNLCATVQGHMANPDDSFPPDAARALETKLRQMGKAVQFTIHPAKHAFMNEENPLGHYDKALAQTLWPQVCDFFHQTLNPNQVET